MRSSAFNRCYIGLKYRDYADNSLRCIFSPLRLLVSGAMGTSIIIHEEDVIADFVPKQVGISTKNKTSSLGILAFIVSVVKMRIWVR